MHYQVQLLIVPVLGAPRWLIRGVVALYRTSWMARTAERLVTPLGDRDTPPRAGPAIGHALAEYFRAEAAIGGRRGPKLKPRPSEDDTP
jgi:hypothetical protein